MNESTRIHCSQSKLQRAIATVRAARNSADATILAPIQAGFLKRPSLQFFVESFLGHPVLARCADILGTQLAREDGIKHSGRDAHVNECSRFEDMLIPLGGSLKLQIGQQGGMWSSYVDVID